MNLIINYTINTCINTWINARSVLFSSLSFFLFFFLSFFLSLSKRSIAGWPLLLGSLFRFRLSLFFVPFHLFPILLNHSKFSSSKSLMAACPSLHHRMPINEFDLFSFNRITWTTRTGRKSHCSTSLSRSPDRNRAARAGLNRRRSLPPFRISPWALTWGPPPSTASTIPSIPLPWPVNRN